MTYMHVVMKAMLLLCCIQAMDPYSPPPPVKKKKNEEKGGLGNMTAATLCFYALFNWLSK